MPAHSEHDSSRPPFVLHPTLDELLTLIYVKDLDGRITSANRAFSTLLAVPREELIGKPTGPLLRSDGPESDRIDREVLASGEARLGILEKYKGDKGPRWFITDKAPIRGPDGYVCGLVGTSIEVTEQLRAMQELTVRERLLDMASDAVIVHDLQGNILYANRAAGKMRGCSPEELLNLNMSDIDRVEGSSRFEERMARLKECGHLTFVSREHSEDGSEQSVEVSATLTTVNERQLVLRVVRDTTAREQAREALWESERNYRELFEQSLDAVSLVTPEGKLLEANPAWYRLFGFSPNDVSSLNVQDVYVDPDGRARFLELIASAGKLTDEVRFKRKDGTEFDCRRLVKARYGADGSLIGFQTVFHDVTEQRRAEASLKDSEARFRKLAENLQDAVARLAPDMTLLYANPALDGLAGHPHRRLVGQKLTDMPHMPGSMDAILGAAREAFVTGWPTGGTSELTTSRGRRFVDWHIMPEIDDTGRPQTVLLTVHDITQLREVQRALEDSHQRLRELTGYLHDVRERERTLLARDIHDHLSQALTALRLDLAAVRDSTPASATQLDAAIHMVDALADDVRRMSTELRPGMLDDLGLRAAMDWQLSQFSERTGIVCEMKISESDADIPSTTATVLFRVLQELLTNVERHSSATVAKVSLHHEDDRIVLIVTDNGSGIREEQVTSRRSLGLLGIRERIRSLGGGTRIKGKPGTGTTAEVWVPIDNEGMLEAQAA